MTHLAEIERVTLQIFARHHKHSLVSVILDEIKDYLNGELIIGAFPLIRCYTIFWDNSVGDHGAMIELLLKNDSSDILFVPWTVKDTTTDDYDRAMRGI